VSFQSFTEYNFNNIFIFVASSLTYFCMQPDEDHIWSKHVAY